MPKTASVYICQQCGYQSPSFLGRCPNCDAWNSLVETVQAEARGEKSKVRGLGTIKAIKLSEIKTTSISRVSTGIPELDQVLGGGIVPGMVVLLAGEPGIGKSTLLLEIARTFSGPVLYVAGEESASQIKIRTDRLGFKADNLQVLEATDVDIVCSLISQVPSSSLVIVDSIQTMSTEDLVGTAGSVGQVRECAARLINSSKPRGLPLFLVGHVTKEGAIAGPKVLEHAVDTILTIEGERYGNLRLIRTTKNRFGPTDEVGIFEMTDKGLTVVSDISKLFTEKTDTDKPGSCLTVTMEGSRPLLVEIQALVTSTPLPNPRRVASGVDYNRLLTLVAILQKRLSIPLYKEDIYVSVAGGLKIAEPAADLAMALAIISSYRSKSLPARTLAIGELDLLGNIRRVNNLDRRAREGKKLGFTTILSENSIKNLSDFSWTSEEKPKIFIGE